MSHFVKKLHIWKKSFVTCLKFVFFLKFTPLGPDLRRLRSDLLNPKFGSQKSALL